MRDRDVRSMPGYQSAQAALREVDRRGRKFVQALASISSPVRGRPVNQAKVSRARALRAKGLTWEAVGSAIGTTRQGASQLVKRANIRDHR